MTENRELLRKNDVIKLYNDNTGFMPHTTFTVNDFINELLLEFDYTEECENWVKNGVEAKVLVAGKSWRKGKVRLTMEFIPDEASIESPLDEFRNKLNIL